MNISVPDLRFGWLKMVAQYFPSGLEYDIVSYFGLPGVSTLSKDFDAGKLRNRGLRWEYEPWCSDGAP